MSLRSTSIIPSVVQATQRVSFPQALALGYNILGLGNTMLSPVSNMEVVPVGTGISIPVFVSQNPQFWIETDCFGVQNLCTTKTIYSVLTAQFQNPVGGPIINTVAIPFDSIFNEATQEYDYMPHAETV